MATIHFTSSEAFLESDPKAAESAELEAVEYVECTYNALRTNPNTGEEIAWLIDGAWQLPDGRRFSDWAVNVAGEESG